LLSEDFVDGYLGRDYLERLKSADAELAEKIGASYWDIQKELNLNEDDFKDFTHLRSFGAANRFTRKIAAMTKQMQVTSPEV
jgi:hypothetical protein